MLHVQPSRFTTTAVHLSRSHVNSAAVDLVVMELFRQKLLSSRVAPQSTDGRVAVPSVTFSVHGLLDANLCRERRQLMRE